MEDYECRIADISLADWGRKDIELSEVEMPGLMNCREEYKGALIGAKVTGSLHMTVQTAVLIETLVALGAEVRWCSANISSTQDHAAAAIVAAKSAHVFAWRGETLEEFWECMEKAFFSSDSEGPDLLIDDGCDMTFLIHEGAKWEKIYQTSGELPKPEEEKDQVHSIILKRIRDGIEAGHYDRYTKAVAKLVGVAEETTTGIYRLEELAQKNELLLAAINVNDSVTKSKFDNIYGCRHSLPDGIMRATDVMIAGKKVVICGYGNVGKGCAEAMKGAGAKVIVTEADPICALQACMQGFEVKRLSTVVSTADIFITTTGNERIITPDDMALMKNNAIVGNIGHFDKEIDVEGLKKYPDIERINIKPQCDRFKFPDGHGVIVLAEGRVLNLG